ncbi:hypothetical protein BCR43DRAFT_519261 [Syncephalastrum racemosum]|uniref:RING-type domain-containing protein n=1 Tax=Syncephalastrum racemosum TaxID=13706 RepID=A0A1X2GZP2_SYNRA|nr:hypothetical protein BCR43DRAFT_519261 [Syncephalastrum racemosum]
MKRKRTPVPPSTGSGSSSSSSSSNSTNNNNSGSIISTRSASASSSAANNHHNNDNSMHSAIPLQSAKDAPLESYLPVCPICRENFAKRTFLQPCFHSFCFYCIRQWINVRPNCPICITGIDSLVYDIDDASNTFQEYALGDKTRHDPPERQHIMQPSRQERLYRKRAQIYRGVLEPVRYPPPARSMQHLHVLTPGHMPKVSQFLCREVPAVMGPLNDGFIEQHIRHILLIPYEQLQRSSRRRQNNDGNDTMNADIITSIEHPEIARQLAEWMTTDADVAARFLRELMAFVKSGMDYWTFVKQVEYDFIDGSNNGDKDALLADEEDEDGKSN